MKQTKVKKDISKNKGGTMFNDPMVANWDSLWYDFNSTEKWFIVNAINRRSDHKISIMDLKGVSLKWSYAFLESISTEFFEPGQMLLLCIKSKIKQSIYQSNP